MAIQERYTVETNKQGAMHDITARVRRECPRGVHGSWGSIESLQQRGVNSAVAKRQTSWFNGGQGLRIMYHHNSIHYPAGFRPWRVFLTPWSWALLCLAGAAMAAFYFAFRVEITRADVAEITPSGETLVIEGNNFRRRQRQGYILHETASGEMMVLDDVRLWSNKRIEVNVPDHVASGGSVRVIQTTPLWEWPSNSWPLGTSAFDYRRLPDLAQPTVASAPAKSSSPNPPNTGREASSGSSPLSKALRATNT